MYSSEKLTHRQKQIFNFLRNFKSKEGIAPTYREISAHFNFKSTKAASDHVRALEKKGYVRRHGNRSRGIEVISSEAEKDNNAITIPVLGAITAGTPEKKEQQQSNSITVDNIIIGDSKNHKLFALQVDGHSMVGRSICDGDWVVADVDVSPREGDVVVALIDGESTLKTLAKKRNRVYLKSENPDFLDWFPLEEIVIQGVVKAVLRRT